MMFKIKVRRPVVEITIFGYIGISLPPFFFSNTRHSFRDVVKPRTGTELISIQMSFCSNGFQQVNHLSLIIFMSGT